MPVGLITKELSVRALKEVWSVKPKTVKNLRERLEKLLGYAIWKGYRDGPNPAVWTDNLEHEFALRTIPAAHTKRKRADAVPLSGAAIALLKVISGRPPDGPS